MILDAKQVKQKNKRPPQSVAGYMPQSLAWHLSRTLEGYEGLPEKQQRAVCMTVFRSMCCPHRVVKCAFWQDHKQREQSYGRGEFMRLHDRLGIIRRVCHGRPSKGHSDALALTEKGRAIVEGFLSLVQHSGESFPVHVRRLVDIDGYACRSYEGRAAIHSRTATGGRTRFPTSESFRALVAIDVARLRALADACDKWLQGGAVLGFAAEVAAWNERRANNHHWAFERVRRVRDCALLLCHTADCMEEGGGRFPVVYREHSTGRLYADGALNLQTVPREVRRAALHGCWTYDLENAHYSILRQLAARLGMETPRIDAYLNAKTQTRQELAEHAGIPVSAAKAILIALIYGASIYAKGDDSAMVQEAGRDGAERLRGCKTLQLLHGEVQHLAGAVVAQYKAKGKQGRLINDMGRQYEGENDKAKQLAFILQGIEARILCEVIERHPHQLRVILHDGWVTSAPIESAELAEAIRLETGFEVAIDGDQLQEVCPT